MNMISRLTDRARDLGFVAVGFSKPARPLFHDRFLSWVAAHKNADMSWLERNNELREDPSLLLKGCTGIISLAYPYPSLKPGTPDGFTVSRYSQPLKDDYHIRVKALCRDLMDMIREVFPGSRSRVCVDSAPILERSFACSSGMGFTGKNTLLIIPGYGSYCYLAEILTTAPLDVPLVTPMEHQCGSCTLCIDECPTGALEPFRLDASRCLSYLTIEHKGAVTAETGKAMGECFFGCDRCQEVCPFNGGETERELILPSTRELLRMSPEEFVERFGRSALARAGLEKIRTNIQAVTGSNGSTK